MEALKLFVCYRSLSQTWLFGLVAPSLLYSYIELVVSPSYLFPSLSLRICAPSVNCTSPFCRPCLCRMHLQTCFAALSLSLSLTSAVPATDSTVKRDAGLRLIKTSPTDPGKWVTEEDKISKYAAKRVQFVDITDIKDPEVLQKLSMGTSENFRVAAPLAIAYPTTLSHQTEANALIAKTNTNGPKSWLTTLTN